MSCKKVNVCCGQSCSQIGSERVQERLEEAGFEVQKRGCTGYCSYGPNVEVNGNLVHHCDSKDMEARVEATTKLPEGKAKELDADEILKDMEL